MSQPAHNLYPVTEAVLLDLLYFCFDQMNTLQRVRVVTDNGGQSFIPVLPWFTVPDCPEKRKIAELCAPMWLEAQDAHSIGDK